MSVTAPHARLGSMVASLRRVLFAGVVFWSALLLLMVQPVLAKAILPWFGGSAGVWTTSMLFFQTLLLLGYAYAHLLHRRLAVRHQATLHLALLAIAIALLPLTPSVTWKPNGNGSPEWRILGLLISTAGLQYFLLATTSPLLQSWYARVFHHKLPYRLFAVSNLGSLVALLSYPVLIEPWLPVSAQLQWWSVGFIVFAAICGLAAALSWRQADPAPDRGERPDASIALTWFALAATPSVLWLAVGNHISQDVAAVPFLWIMPLALYLLSFVLCFDHDRWYLPRLLRWILPPAWFGMIAVVAQRGDVHITTSTAALMIGLFLSCMFCHGELARLRPDPRALTSYYLVIAAGGAFGGFFVGIVAPRIFTEYFELPFGLLSCVVLSVWLLYGIPARRSLRIGAVTAAAAVAAVFVDSTAGDREMKYRNFYGTLRTADTGEDDLRKRILFNGSIEHGLQFLEDGRTEIPTTYYGPASGAAIALRFLQESERPLHVGVIGLGVGTMAAYGREGDRYTFYEINPTVVRLARTDFQFLSNTDASIEIVGGDARLALETQEPQDFDYLVVDAFAGDSIPVHLLTREAFEQYFRHLKQDGAIAVHTTNKHLELSPVVELTAAQARAAAYLIHNSREPERGIHTSSWVIVTRNPNLMGHVAWLSSPIPRNQRLRPWSDDFTNLLTILR